MTDSTMNFGPSWIRNLRSEGTAPTGGGGTSPGVRYQLAEYRYGREEMLALFDKSVKPPPSLTTFKTLLSETTLVPLALLPTSEEEQRGWQNRPTSTSGTPRGRGGSLERGGRNPRGRGGYQPYGGRATSAFDSSWGNGEQPDWSPRKDYTRSVDNWRRVRNNSEDEEGWRNITSNRSLQEKWGRSASWRGEGDTEPPSRTNWAENRGGPLRRSWENEDHLPEWATENPTEGGGTFDERGAFHGSDDELDGKGGRRPLQKSTSQQQISRHSQSGLSSSKSSISLSRSDDSSKIGEEDGSDRSKQNTKEDTAEQNKPPSAIHQSEKDLDEDRDQRYQERPTNGQLQQSNNIDKGDEDFDRLQEDLVSKLVVDEEAPKPAPNFEMGAVQPPPNLASPAPSEKWFYQDPQGTKQGPFAAVEMAEWYKAGYFSNQLCVLRECDERYFLLGELINMCGGENPFLANMKFPVLKNENVKLPDDMLPYQLLSQLAFNQQVSMRSLAEPWSALTLQQQELAAQRLLMQQQQVPHDLGFMQQSATTNPFMYMINQIQGNKLPGSVLVDKPNNAVPSQLDPLLMQMGNVHSLQNRIQQPTPLHNHLPSGLPTNLSSSLPPDGLARNLSALQTPAGLASLSSIHGSRSSESIPQNDNNVDPIANFLRQFQQQQRQAQGGDSLWQKQNFFNTPPPPVTAPSQWPQQPETPLSMWDLQGGEAQNEKKDKKEEKEMKKRKEQEEKQAKKDAEEKRKQEQRKLEVEKKAAEEKRKKEEEKIKKELEKAKKEAEEKRLRELEEKRRLKEQRKSEEDARKRAEELKKLEDDRIRKENREREERNKEAARQAARSTSKAAPWCQSSSNQGMSLADIQKLEKERKAQETALQVQKQIQEQQQQQQQQTEKANLQLNWAKKPVESRKEKSFAEIQEEQERLAKLAAESRLAAQLKEKDFVASTNTSNSIWNGQSLTWASATSTSQWSSTTATGFWDEVPAKPTKPSTTVSKSNSSAMTTTKPQQQQQPKQTKTSKTTKKEEPKSVNNNNNESKGEFTDWCCKALSSMSANVDIPTFVSFLRDIESAYDVKDYCKEYLGDSPATQQFASNFLEKRRSFKPKNNAHKDDMCSPAPAITPLTQHSTEFQEVKGKNKKNKKSKMLKVDSRILGFNVTSAPDRINVGDRDYGDNS